MLWPVFFPGQRPGRCSTFTICRNRICSSLCTRVLITVLLLVGAAAAAAALAPALLSFAILPQALVGSCCCCCCCSSSSFHVCDKWLGPGRRDRRSPDKAGMTATVRTHQYEGPSTLGARPTAPCASGALISSMLSTRELQLQTRLPPQPRSGVACDAWPLRSRWGSRGLPGRGPLRGRSHTG
jgi:hypothetical protein